MTGLSGRLKPLILLLLVSLFPSFALPKEGLFIRGIVKDENGKVERGVIVSAWAQGEAVRLQGTTNESGSFSIGPVMSGRFRVMVRQAGFALASQEVVVENQDVEVIFSLKPDPGSAGQPKAVAPERNRSPSQGQNQHTARNRGFQSLTLQAPEGIDASRDTLSNPSSSQLSNVPAPEDLNNENRSSETLLIQGSTNLNPQNSPFGGDLSEDQRQEMRERMRERMAHGDFGGGPSGWNRGGGPGGPGGFGGGGFGGPGGGRGFRGGSNRIRGSLFENYNNSALDARPFSFSGLEQKKLSYIQNRFGASLGGPLTLPGIYKGADKTSFFVNYTGTRQETPSDTTVTVPTAAEREGDFSQSLTRVGANLQPVSIFDPTLGGAESRQFPDNRIPVERIDPIARGLLNYVPLPNLPGNVLNYHLQQNLAANSDMIMVRLNHRLTSRDNVNAAYSFSQRSSLTGQVFQDFLTTQEVRGQNVNLGWTHNFSGHVINNAGFRFNRMRTSSLNQFAFVQDVEGTLGITGVSQNPMSYGVPTIRWTNYATLQDTNPLLSRNQTSHANESITYIKGKHTFRSGAEYRRIQLNNRTEPNARGTFNFTGLATSAFGAQGKPVTGTGYDLADFLLGFPQSTSVRYGEDSAYFRGNVLNLYFLDNWKVSPGLTVNMGVRYELAEPFIEIRDHISNLDIAPNFTGASPVLPGESGPFSGQFPHSLVDPDRNNVAPRFGVAWRPFGLKNTVIRSGYGIFYNASIYNQIYLQLASQPPFAVSNNLVTRLDQILTLANGFPVDPQITVFNSYAIDRNLRVGYVQQWNLDWQQQFRHNLVLTLSYNGSKGTRLDLLRSPNRTPLGFASNTQEQTIANAQEFLYQTSGASSIFHSMNLRIQRRFTSGFSVNGSYVFGKSIDNASSIGGAQETVALIDTNLRAERGLSAFDIRHQLNVSSVYEFPLGVNKRYLSGGGVAARIFGDWSLSGTATIQSGSPYTARILGNSLVFSNSGANQSERADATGLAVLLPDSLQTVNHFFNTDAFAVPTPGLFGNAGRNTIIGPATRNINVSLSKVLLLSNDGRRLEFRAQASNLLNMPNFSGLGTVVDASNFGRLTSAKSMRQIDFTLRLNF